MMSAPPRSSTIQTAVVLTLVVSTLYFARAILIPLAFAITLALVLSPAVGWLQKLHMRRMVAVLIVMLVTLMVAGFVSFVILNDLVSVLNDLPGYRENIDQKIKTFHITNNGALGRAAQSVKEIGKELATPPDAPATPSPVEKSRRTATPENPLPVQLIEAPANGLTYVREISEPFFAPLAVLGIVLVFTVFLLAEETDLRNRIFRLAGLNRLNLVTKALEDATHRVSRYLMLQFLVNAAFGVLCGTGLYFIGVPYAALWGTVAALLRIVPYVGSVAAGLLPLLLSLAVFDGWRQPLLVFGLFTTLELVTANLLEPVLYGAHTGISSLALLVTTAFWATLWGPAGLILSTPLTVCVVVLGRHLPQLSFLHVLLGDEPVLSPEAQLYQRLLAMDEQEARTVAETYFKEHSLEELCDQVILPMLTMAQHDRHKGTLDREREEFLFLSLREILVEFSEKAEHPVSNGERSESSVGGRILCFPAHDEADEIAASMLAQLLEQAGRAAIAFPLGSSARSVLGVMEADDGDVLCISAVQPFAFSHAKTINQQLRAKFPRSTILIGIWGYNGERERAFQRFRPSYPNTLVFSFNEALNALDVVSVKPEVAPEPAGSPL